MSRFQLTLENLRIQELAQQQQLQGGRGIPYVDDDARSEFSVQSSVVGFQPTRHGLVRQEQRIIPDKIISRAIKYGVRFPQSDGRTEIRYEHFRIIIAGHLDPPRDLDDQPAFRVDALPVEVIERDLVPYVQDDGPHLITCYKVSNISLDSTEYQVWLLMMEALEQDNVERFERILELVVRCFVVRPVILPIINYLDDKCKKVSAEGFTSRHTRTLLSTAAQLALPEIVDALLRHGADPNMPQAPALQAAAAGRPWDSISPTQRFATVERFCATRGIDINLANRKGMTPLLSALYNGRNDIAALLIEHGANVFRPNVYDESPFHLLVQDRLLSRGVNLPCNHLQELCDRFSHAPVKGIASEGPVADLKTRLDAAVNYYSDHKDEFVYRPHEDQATEMGFIKVPLALVTSISATPTEYAQFAWRFDAENLLNDGGEPWNQWCSNFADLDVPEQQPILTQEFSQTLKIGAYRVSSVPSDTGTFPQSAPSSWEMEGKAANTGEWVLMHSATDVSFTRGNEYHTVLLSEEVAQLDVLAVRLRITGTGQHGNAPVALGHWHLLHKASTASSPSASPEASLNLRSSSSGVSFCDDF